MKKVFAFLIMLLAVLITSCEQTTSNRSQGNNQGSSNGGGYTTTPNEPSKEDEFLDFNDYIDINISGTFLSYTIKDENLEIYNIHFDFFQGQCDVDKSLQSYMEIELYLHDNLILITGGGFSGNYYDFSELQYYPEGQYTMLFLFDSNLGQGYYIYQFNLLNESSLECVITFVNNETGEIINSLIVEKGTPVSLDMFPDTPSSEDGYYYVWSIKEEFIAENSCVIYLYKEYDVYVINYINTLEDSELAFLGYDTYTRKSTILYLHSYYSNDMCFAGWSLSEDGSDPFFELELSEEIYGGVTLYAVWREYTEEEKVFYELLNNTLSLTNFYLTDEYRTYAVSMEDNYLLLTYTQEEGKYLYYNGYKYDYDSSIYYNSYESLYINSEMSEKLNNVFTHSSGFKRITNINKTSDGYTYQIGDLIFTVASNGEIFTSCKRSDNRIYSLSAEDINIEVPTGFKFDSRNYVFVVENDNSGYAFAEYIYNSSYLSYNEFITRLNEVIYVNYDSSLILYLDSEKTTTLTEDHYNSYLKNNTPLVLYMDVIDFDYFVNNTNINVNVYVNYYNTSTGMFDKEYYDTFNVNLGNDDFYQQFYNEIYIKDGYIHADTIYIEDERGLLFSKEIYGNEIIYQGSITMMLQKEWLYHDLTDYSINIIVEGHKCETSLVTIDGYEPMWVSSTFNMNDYVLENDGKIVTALYYDEALTQKVENGDILDSEVTLYPSWEYGGIVDVNVYCVNVKENLYYSVSSADYVYDTIMGLYISYPLYYDEACTMPVGLYDKVGNTTQYYFLENVELVYFDILINGDSITVAGYEGLPLNVWAEHFNGLGYLNNVNNLFEEHNCYPVFNDEVIESNKSYEIETKPFPVYSIYLGDYLLTSFIYNKNDVNANFPFENYKYVDFPYGEEDKLIECEYSLTSDGSQIVDFNLELPDEDSSFYLIGEFKLVKIAEITDELLTELGLTEEEIIANLMYEVLPNGVKLNDILYSHLGEDYASRYDIYINGEKVEDFSMEISDYTTVIVLYFK